MQPARENGFAGDRLRLRDLIFVMRKGEVDAAGVDVERLPRYFIAMGGALDVPAGTALPSGVSQQGLPSFCAFQTVAGVVFVVLVHVDARGRLRCR